MSRIRTYRELSRLETYKERFEYLKLGGEVGQDTFGFERHLNQSFYRSHEWKNARNQVIARDLGRDLGVEGYEIHDRIVVHHMNPMIPDDIIHGEDYILDPEYLITTTHDTHNAIHYGFEPPSKFVLVERKPGDTKLW